MRRFILAVLFLCLAAVSHALTFSEIKTWVRDFVGDPLPTIGQPHFSTASVERAINSIQSEMASNTWCSEGKRSYNIVYGQREYVLSDDVISITRLTIDDERITPTSLVKMDDDSTWEATLSTSTPSKYYVVNTTASYIGFDTFPSTTTDHYITIYYIKEPTELSADADIPFDNQPKYASFHIGIVYGATALLLYQDGRPTEADKYYAMYLDRIKAMERIIRLNGDYIPSFSGDSNIK